MNQLATTDAEPGHMLALIERLVKDPNVDLDRLERMLQLRDKEHQRIAEREYHAAMALVQSELDHVRADCKNDQTRSKYASLAAVDAVVRPVTAARGFAISFNTEPTERVDWVRVTCKISHSSGHSEIAAIDMPADGKGARGNDVMTKTHAVGSAISYARRYLLCMVFSLAIDRDDDGNAASYRRQEPPRRAPVPAPNPMLEPHDPVSGEVIEAAGERFASEIASDFDKSLGNAAAFGTEALKKEWTRIVKTAKWKTLPPLLADGLTRAKERRHKPTARDADQRKAPELIGGAG